METLLMSNICPQLGTLNSGMWRSSERASTSDLVGRWDDLWVIAGPSFGPNPQNVPGTNVQIPDGLTAAEEVGRVPAAQ